MLNEWADQVEMALIHLKRLFPSELKRACIVMVGSYDERDLSSLIQL